jgi:putative ABC transport system permease protein
MRTLPLGFRTALRPLARRPAHAAAAVLTLALGIGVATAVWSVLDAALLRPLPYPDAGRLVSVLAVRPRRGPEAVGIAPADFLAWRERSRSFAALGAYVPFGSLDLTGAGEPVRLERHLVSDGLLQALGIQAAVGRLFLADEYRPGGRRVVVLGERLWHDRFGGDPRVVGRLLTLGGERCEVVGVLPRGVRLPGGDPDLLAPLAFGPADAADRSAGYLGGIGRLRPGVSLAAARAEMAALAGSLARQFPASNQGLAASVVPLRELFTRQSRAALWVVFAAVTAVLLIACGNVANLQLVRALSRLPELGVRAALGATAPRLVGQLLAETSMLAVMGGALGVPIAWAALRLLPDARGIYLPASASPGIDLRVLGFAAAITVACALAAGLAPALRVVFGGGPATTLLGRRDGAWGGTGAAAMPGRGRERAQAALVMVEVALACTLSIAAGLLLRGFHRLLEQPPGFCAGHVLAFDVALPAARYRERPQIAAFYRELVARLESLPGVLAAAAATEVPPDEPWGFHLRIAGEARTREVAAGWQLVTPGYFTALRLPLLAGRPITALDRSGSRRVAVLGESAARLLLGGGDALGRQVIFNGGAYEIVGVVKDVWNPGEHTAQPTAYFALDQATVPLERMRAMSVVLRGPGDPLRLAAAARRGLRSLDRDLPAGRMAALASRIAAAVPLARPRLDAQLTSAFAGLAALLAMVGIYGVLSFAVDRRTREIGVRMALGAGRGDLVRLVLRRGMAPAAAGMAAGLLGAFWLARLLASLRIEAGSAEPRLFAAVTLGLTAVAAFACWLPARRASRLDPLAALRQE